MSKQDVPVEQPTNEDWEIKEFTKEEVDSWKARYGVIHLIEDDNDNKYVMRGLGRKEYEVLEAAQYRNEQDYENKFVEQTLLYPQLSEMKLRQMDAGDVKNLFDRIAIFSNQGAANGIQAEEFVPETHGPKLQGTDIKDWTAWIKAARGRKIFFVELEDKGFVFRNLSRSQYETYRTKVQTDNATQNSAENTVCIEGVIYPLPENFKPDSDQFLYGTISSLAVLIMKESGFGKAVKITKL